MLLSIVSIVLISLNVLLTPLHFYGWFKLYQFRQHFLIINRFPIEVAIISAATVIINQNFLIRMILVDVDIIEFDGPSIRLFSATILPMSYLSVSLIFYRAHLVYLKCKQQNTMVSDYVKTSDGSKKVGQYATSRFLLVYIVLACLVMSVVPLVVSIAMIFTIFSALWVVLYIIAIIIGVRIWRSKTREELRILTDILVTIILYVIVTIAMRSPLDVRIGFISIYFCQNMYGLFPLWFGLILVRKYEGSLTVSKMLNKVYDYQNPNIYKKVSGLHEPMPSASQMTQIDESEPLFIYLQQKINYNVFESYLSLVFAVENMKFVTNVLIFYHCVKQCKLKSEELNTSVKDDNVIYGLRFDYLEDIYTDYKRVLYTDIASDHSGFDEYKHNLSILCEMIYLRFVARSAPEEINISAKNRHRIMYAMQEENKDKFVSFDDYLTLYHNALIEAWQLMENCYSYRFRNYSKNI